MMHPSPARLKSIALILFLSCILFGTNSDAQAIERLRVIIETDAGGDRDDQATLVRMLMYTNEWDIEGIIADRTSTNNLNAGTGLNLVRMYLNAYGDVVKNLKVHDARYPSKQYLWGRTKAGYNTTDDGVNLIIKAADKNDLRPIWYSNWGSNSGTTSNLRRAFDKVKTKRSTTEYRKFVKKFRIVTLDGATRTKQKHDDEVVLHIETGYPVIAKSRWYHRFRHITKTAGGFNLKHDVKINHGPLGALYTTQKEGDSWTIVYLCPTGMGDPLQPSWGGWAGRYGLRDQKVIGPAFYWANQEDTWRGSTNRENTAKRWASDLQNDFKARMDYSVANNYTDANHPPEPHLNGDSTKDILFEDVPAGGTINLSASGSTDPDGNNLSFKWTYYREPGTYNGSLSLFNSTFQNSTVNIPFDAKGKKIHIILSARDDGSPMLTRYRRVVLNILPEDRKNPQPRFGSANQIAPRKP